MSPVTFHANLMQLHAHFFRLMGEPALQHGKCRNGDQFRSAKGRRLSDFPKLTNENSSVRTFPLRNGIASKQNGNHRTRSRRFINPELSHRSY